MLYFSVKSLSDTQNKNNSKTKQNKTFSRNFLYKFIPSGNRFSIILSNRTSGLYQGYQGVVYNIVYKVKEPP